MRLKGEAYSRRLESYSDSTIRLIMELNSMDKETALKESDITTDSELDETEVVRRLENLKEQALTKTGT